MREKIPSVTAMFILIYFSLRVSHYGPQVRSAAGRIMSMTHFGIEPAIFRFLAQCLKHMRHSLTTRKYIKEGYLNTKYKNNIFPGS